MNSLGKDTKNYKAFDTLNEMMNDRGYSVVNDSKNSDYVLFKGKGKDDIGIFITTVAKLCIKTLKEILHITEERVLRHILIMYQDSITPFVLKIINNIKNIKVEYFSVNELQYNITKHSLQPIFEKLTKDEIKSIRVKIKNIEKLPIMFTVDPIARYYNYQQGDVIRVRRRDIVCYRYVDVNVVL
tara:strand:+ start:169 stop:723 length:555 start_codon:yes stop_codon:yes gene_type:complete